MKNNKVKNASGVKFRLMRNNFNVESFLRIDALAFIFIYSHIFMLRMTRFSFTGLA